MNEALKSLYLSKWDKLTAALGLIVQDQNMDIKPANPLLIYVDDEDEYKNADIRLLIYGQETNGWYEKGNGSIEEITALYDGFFNEGDCWNYGGPFWNGVSRFLSFFSAEYS